jgi:hypothetical protein
MRKHMINPSVRSWLDSPVAAKVWGGFGRWVKVLLQSAHCPKLEAEALVNLQVSCWARMLIHSIPATRGQLHLGSTILSLESSGRPSPAWTRACHHNADT